MSAVQHRALTPGLSLTLLAGMAGLTGAGALSAAADTTSLLPAQQQWVDKMAAQHGFDAQRLTQLLQDTAVRQDIIDAISRPAEALPWYRYRPIFIKDERIEQGARFILDQKEWLAKAEQTYGVPAEYVTAILGVETFYGRIQGRFPVIEALNTLAFHYPKRADFFTRELEHFLILARQEDWPLGDPKGSYAGAMGMGQFISSSYRHYAVDFDKNGKIDLFNSVPDAIGSIANYFARHGWQPGQPVAQPVQVTDAQRASKIAFSQAKKPQHTVKELAPLLTDVDVGSKGDDDPVKNNASASLYAFEVEQGVDYWLGYHNFYVITRYNHSPLYALAVHQLAQRIKQSVGELTLSRGGDTVSAETDYVDEFDGAAEGSLL